MKPDVIVVWLAVVLIAWRFIRPLGSRPLDTLPRRWSAMDALKGFACLAVVIIHYHPKGAGGDLMNAVCKFAVPLFFCVSGFFLPDASGELPYDRVIRKIGHVFGIILWAAVFYAFYTLAWQYWVHGSFNAADFCSAKVTAGRIVKFFITNDPFVYAHLWFLLALLYCYFLALFVGCRPGGLRKLSALTPFFIIAAIYVHELARAIPWFHSGLPIPESKMRIYYFNLPIFRALPFFALGITARYWHAWLVRTSLRANICLVLAMLGGIASFGEFLLLGRGLQFYVGSYVTLAMLFMWAIRNEGKTYGFLAYVGRELSLYVYVLHIAVGKVFDVLAGRYHWWGAPWFNGEWYGLRWVFVFCATLMVAQTVVFARRCMQHRLRAV